MHFCSRMAWESKEAEVLSIAVKHWGVLDDEMKKKMCDTFTLQWFPNLGHSWSETKWVTQGGVTYVTLWGNDHLLPNLKFAMAIEHIGMGPHKYCLISNTMPDFEAKLMLTLAYLPRQKICFYPPLFVLGEPFHRQPWKEWGKRIACKTLKSRNPLVRTIFHAQAFVILQHTGYYDPSFWI